MNRYFRFLLQVLLFVTLFVLVHPVVEWITGGEFAYTKVGMLDAFFIGLMVPIIMLISKKIKQTWLYIPVAMAVMFLVFLLKNLIFQ